MKATNAQQCHAGNTQGPRTDAKELRKLPEGKAGALMHWAAGQLHRGAPESGREAQLAPVEGQAGSKGRSRQGGDAPDCVTESAVFHLSELW